MSSQRDFENIWHHLKNALSLLPSPLKEERPFASFKSFDYSCKYNNLRGALDALECLAEINDCSLEFHQEVKLAANMIANEPTIPTYSISPLVDHPKNRHIQHKQALLSLSEDDKCVVKECLRVAAYADFFPDWEYWALFGFGREDFVALMEQWPNIDDADKKNARMISNVMNHLLGYPHGKMAEWSNHISVSPEEVLAVVRRWRKLKGWDGDNSEPGYVSSFV